MGYVSTLSFHGFGSRRLFSFFFFLQGGLSRNVTEFSRNLKYFEICMRITEICGDVVRTESVQNLNRTAAAVEEPVFEMESFSIRSMLDGAIMISF